MPETSVQKTMQVLHHVFPCRNLEDSQNSVRAKNENVGKRLVMHNECWLWYIKQGVLGDTFNLCQPVLLNSSGGDWEQNWPWFSGWRASQTSVTSSIIPQLSFSQLLPKTSDTNQAVCVGFCEWDYVWKQSKRMFPHLNTAQYVYLP